jgi:hypothetical protein
VNGATANAAANTRVLSAFYDGTDARMFLTVRHTPV